MSWESKRGYRWPNASTWRRNSSWSEAIRNSTSRRRQRGKKRRSSRNRLRSQSANRLFLSALKTIERLFRADENAIAIYHRRGVNPLVKFARRDNPPFRLVGDDTHHTLFAGEVNL